MTDITTPPPPGGLQQQHAAAARRARCTCTAEVLVRKARTGIDFGPAEQKTGGA